VILEKNGIVILTATGVAVLVNPPEVVAWLANKLHGYDIRLRKGEMIMLGSFVRALDIEPGLLFRATSVEGFSCAKSPECIDL
jgi:2-keto-4-pentenoate hydratase